LDRQLKKRLKSIENQVQKKNPRITLAMRDGSTENVLLDDLINIVIPQEQWKNRNMEKPMETVSQAVKVENTPLNRFLVQKAKEIKDYPAHCALVAEMQAGRK
jgi:hypothetical protein